MLFRYCIPSSPLSDFVALLWYAEAGPQPHARERLLPTGTMELISDLRHDAPRVYDRENRNQCQTFRGPVICGAYSEHFVIDTAGQASVMGVHFRPGGAFPFFRCSAAELHNAHVSLDALWGRAAHGLREQLLEAKSLSTRFHILESALLAQLARPLQRHPAVAFALNELNGMAHTRTISDLTRQIALSPKRFIQVFQDQVGLTPKLFCRIRRFQRVLRLLHTGRRVDWADLASACGYFDQPHFIHDFRAFSGLSPGAYLTVRGEHLNHVPIPG